MAEPWFRRVLAVGAHCDDIEIACGGTVHRLSQAGVEVTGLILTDTHYVRDGAVHRDTEVAKRENREAAAILGYEPIFCDLSHYDFAFSQDLIYLIRDQVERLKIDTLLTHWHEDAQAHHRDAAHATMAAARDNRNVLFYRSNFYPTPGTFHVTLTVDISDHVEAKRRGLACYQSELERSGDGYFDWVIAENELLGARCGVRHAEGFQLLKAHL